MYRTVLVHMNNRDDATARLRFGIDIAKKFDAVLVGLTAALPVMPLELYAASTGAMTSGMYEAFDRTHVEAEFGITSKAFDKITTGSQLETEWRTEFDVPAQAILRGAATADIVVVAQGVRSKLSEVDTATAGDVVLAAGRPTLMVPKKCDVLPAKPDIVVAWKETTAARRALADALPFMKLGGKVHLFHVEESADEQGHMRRAEMFLMRHGIAVTSHSVGHTTGGTHFQLLDFARKHEINLIVSGAYGHSRLREWMFGGVTQGLLTDAPIACLLSH